MDIEPPSASASPVPVPPVPVPPVQWYPVLLDFSGRDCLVVGGGVIGARKAEALLAAGAIVTLVAKEVGAHAHRLAESGRLSIATRAYEASDLDGKWYVVTAIDDPAITAQIKLEADTRRVWMNAADDPPNCSVILPAVHRDRDVIVAISTAGASPATAGWLRDRVANELGDVPGRLAGEVRIVRDRVRRFRSSEGMPWTPLVGALAHAFGLDPDTPADADTGEANNDESSPDDSNAHDSSAHDSSAQNSNMAARGAIDDAIEKWLVASCRPDECRSCTTTCLARLDTAHSVVPED